MNSADCAQLIPYGLKVNRHPFRVINRQYVGKRHTPVSHTHIAQEDFANRAPVIKAAQPISWFRYFRRSAPVCAPLFALFVR